MPDSKRKTVLLIGTSGGTGVSVVAALLANQLATYGSVLLLDLKIGRCGDLSTYFALPATLGEVTDRMLTALTRCPPDGTLPELGSAICRAGGTHILGAGTPAVTSRLMPQDLRKLIDLLKREFQYVVIDWGGPCDQRLQSVVTCADYSVNVSTTELASVRNLCEWHQALRQWVGRARWAYCLNRVQDETRAATVKKLLDIEPIAVLPRDKRIATTVTNGEPLTGKTFFECHFVPFMKLLDVSDAEKAAPAKRLFQMGWGKSPAVVQDIKPPSDLDIEVARVRVHRRLVDRLAHNLVRDSGRRFTGWNSQERAKVESLTAVLIEEDPVLDELSGSKRREITEQIVNEVLGLGPLEKHLKDAEITEIIVNGPREVFVEIGGKLVATKDSFSTEESVLRIIERVISPLGRRIDESSPMVDARLPDGSRVNAVIPPISLNGPMLTIRKFPSKPMRLEDLVQLGSLSEKMAELLRRAVLNKKNILISGGTGSGKTTLLNALSAFIPEHERVITIEDAAELRLQQRHVARLEARPPNTEGKGAIPIRSLVRNALRMRPDRIIVGEVRGGEALDMLQAMNTGHSGSMTTAHANSPRDLLSRLETMVLMAEIDLPIRAIAKQIAGALDLIVHQSRLPDGSRKVVEICEVEGLIGDEVSLRTIFKYSRPQGLSKNKPVFEFFGLSTRLEEELSASVS